MANQGLSGKLVRDKIPEIIGADGGDPNVRTLNDEEYTASLKAKLIEEVDELLTAPVEKRTEEVADVIEVLQAMVQNYGLKWDAVEVECLRKRGERGGFEARVWLEQ